MSTTPTEGWGRGKLLAILGTALAVGMAILLGLGLFAWQLLRPDPPGQDASGAASLTMVGESPAVAEAGPERRAQVASAPMLRVEDPRDFREGEVTAALVGAIDIPPATVTGPVGVPTGYPQTPEGAVAQLAAILVVVVEGMSVPATHETYRAWAAGEPDPAGWVMTGNVTDFLTAAGQAGQEAEVGLVVTAIPVAGQVKGSDGDGWVLACVLLDLRATLVEQARVAYGHCEAMTWDGDRWLIDPTYPVATAPSTWPGTDLAAQAGWLTWATDTERRRPWGDLPNPFEYLAGKAVGELVTDAWTSIMMAIWASGLWFLRTVLGLVDSLLTPDVTAGGPAGQVYRTTFWLAVVMVLILAMVQLGVAAWTRRGADLAQAGVGVAQFVVVFAAWIGYCVMILAAAQGLTRSLMQAMFGV